MRDVNRLLDRASLGGNAIRAVQECLEKIGTRCWPSAQPEEEEGQVPPEIQALAGERQAARKAKEFTRADSLRKELEEQGWLVEDTAKGPRLLKK